MQWYPCIGALNTPDTTSQYTYLEIQWNVSEHQALLSNQPVDFLRHLEKLSPLWFTESKLIWYIV